MLTTFNDLLARWAGSAADDYSSSSSSSSRRRNSEEREEVTPERAQAEAHGYIQEAQKFQLLTADQSISLDKLFNSFRTLETSYAKTARSLRKRVTECNTVRNEHAKASLRLYEAFHLDFQKALTQGNQDQIFKCFLALDRAARRSLSIDAHDIDLIRREHAKAIDQIMPYVLQASSSLKKDVEGLRNASGNCSINALLQMLFSAKPFLNCLLYAPELTELRKAYLQFCGLVEGSINSQTIRRELHELNELISTSASRWEDANEVLSIMSHYVPQNKAYTSYPSMKEVREYKKEARFVENFYDDVSQRTTLQIGQNHAYMEQSIEPQPFVFVDPIAQGHKNEANFEERFYSVFDTDERGNGDASFLHPDDYTHLYSHEPTRSTRRYATTPEFLIVVARRHRRGERINDTAMQMPRVLQLPECAVENNQVDRRLILKSFVVYQPGHYVSYIRKGDRWFYCSDNYVNPVSLKKVDQALYHTSRGGSYLHYYERPKNPSRVAEVPRMTFTPIIDERVSTSQTQIAIELKKQINKKNRNLDNCLNLFLKLDPKLQFHCYELLLDKWIQREGMTRLVLNPKALLPILDSLGEKAKDLKTLLEQEKVDLKAMATLFTQFDFFDQIRCYRFICKDFIQKKGVDEFVVNPIKALTRRVYRLPVLDHLIDASKQQPPKAIVKEKKISQIEIVEALDIAVRRKNTTLIKQLVEQLDKKYRPEKIDAIDTRELYFKILDDLPVIPNAIEISKIITAAHEGMPYDVKAFEALITPEHVNDYWPGKIKSGTVLHHIVKRQAKIDHLLPLLEVLAKKGADFNFPDLTIYKNTPLMWAIANANYDTAWAMLDLGSKYGTDFSMLKTNGSPIHLLLAKGYHSVNNDGTQKFENVSGETLLRQLLILAPELVNMVDQHGYTPLHLAVLRRDLEFCRILAEHGADPTILGGPNQESPLDMLDKNAKEATKILEEYTSKGAFLDVENLDSFKEDLGPSIAAAIKDLFPPVTQLAIAFQLQAALESPSSSNLRALFSKLDQKYLKKTTLAALKGNPDLMLRIITKITDDQDSAKKS